MDLLTAIVVIVLVAWVLGLVANVTIGGLIHILLVVAVIAILIRIIEGRHVL